MMGLSFSISDTYTSENGRTKLADIVITESSLTAPEEKIHAAPVSRY